MRKAEEIALIGAGSIGMAWAIVFASAGYTVRLHDTDLGRIERAKTEIAGRLMELAERDLVEENPSEIAARIESAKTLEGAVAGAAYVQECAPEDLALKKTLFAELDRIASADTILASSSSFQPASAFAGELAGRARCLVVHPGNPPYLLRIVEIVPAPFTSATAVGRVRALVAAAGMIPIVLGREIPGFVFNRLQGAVLREAYCLVRDGIATPGDVDLIMTEGLGLRWSLLGPFETADLNMRGGIAAHARTMGPVYGRIARERGADDPWTDQVVEKVTIDRRARLALGDWERRVAWRDTRLMDLLRHRRGRT